MDKEGNESIFDLVIKEGTLLEIKTRRKAGFSPLSEKNQGIAKAFIYIYYAQIVTKWVEYFILRKEIKPETIRKIENLTVDTEKIVRDIKALDNHFYPTEKKQPKVKRTSKSKQK